MQHKLLTTKTPSGGTAPTHINTYQGLDLGNITFNSEHVNNTHNIAYRWVLIIHGMESHILTVCFVSVMCVCCVYRYFCEKGSKKPDLRIGNLVLEGKLVKLSKPLLVLTTNKEKGTNTTQQQDKNQLKRTSFSDADDDTHTKRLKLNPSSHSASHPNTQTLTHSDTHTNTNESSSSSSSPSSSSSSSPHLQSVAVVRWKYVFVTRPKPVIDHATNSDHTNNHQTNKE